MDEIGFFMGLRFPIHETFQSTIQGEGMLAGTMVDFIRLSGCPVGCWFCDTGYSHIDDHGRHIPSMSYTLEQLLAELRSPRVVISGGEPMMNRHLPVLVDAIEASDRHVSIETSGCQWQPVSPTAWVTLSPKEHINPKFPVHTQLWSRANEVKLIISTGTELDHYHLPLKSLDCPVLLQPEWQDYARTLPLTLHLLQAHPTYRLSLQLHKLIGVQ